MISIFDKEKIRSFASREKMALNSLWKWCLFAAVLGTGMGFLSVLFHFLLEQAALFRTSFPLVVLILPFAGLGIIALYRITGNGNDSGTNRVLSAIHSGKNIPLRVAPLVFAGTFITHMFGGSSGREGAALQIGGSMGHWLGDLFKLDDKDKHILIMCGMSACFSAMFGTPAAAAVFSMEVISVGVMYYAALVPCVISAVLARGIAKAMGVASTSFPIGQLQSIDITIGLRLILLGAIFAAASILFILAMQTAGEALRLFFKNPYMKIFVAGWIIVALSFIFGQDWLGSGINLINDSLAAPCGWYVFLLKILFTALTLGSGFKGGEIIPSFCVGATLGSFIAPVLGLPVDVCVACGMVGVFCGVTNSPITSLIIAVEMFGTGPIYYCIITIAVSYLLSEYFSLYKSQRIVYSKYKTSYINHRSE